MSSDPDNIQLNGYILQHFILFVSNAPFYLCLTEGSSLQLEVVHLAHRVAAVTWGPMQMSYPRLKMRHLFLHAL